MIETLQALKRCDDDETLRAATPAEIELADGAPDGVFYVHGIGWCYVQTQALSVRR